MGKLYLLETDGTKDQEAAFKRVAKESIGKKTFSFDLQSATDRFPLYLQMPVLEALFGKEVAESWKILLVDRLYGVKSESGRSIKWAVGQPLGAYSSWALFSLTHHLVVQFCAVSSGVIPPNGQFLDYQILGDDIVIWNEQVALKYRRFLEDHDVKVSDHKSMVSPSHISAGEFCKRIFVRGVELSPLSPVVLERAYHSIYEIPALLIQLSQRWLLCANLVEHYALGNIFNLSNKGLVLLEILLSFRKLQKGELKGSFFWLHDLTTLITELSKYLLKYRFYAFLGRRGRVSPKGEPSHETLVREFRGRGIEVSTSLLLPNYEGDPHPILLAIQSMAAKLSADHVTTANTAGQFALAMSVADTTIEEDRLGMIKVLKHPNDVDIEPFFRKFSDSRQVRVVSELAISFHFHMVNRLANCGQPGG